MILPCILFTRHEKTLSFLSIYFYTSLLQVAYKAYFSS